MHDATTGFHDIKPLPQFLWAREGLSIFYIVLAGLSLVVLASMIRKYFRKPVASPVPQLSPKATALAQLTALSADLAGHKTTLRAYTAGLSAAVREYSGTVLNFAAIDLTALEIKAQVTQGLQSALPVLPSDKRSSWIEDLVTFLLRCDRISYGDDSDVTFSVDDAHLRDLAKTAAELVTQLDTWLAKERERRQGVIGSANQTQEHSTHAVS